VEWVGKEFKRRPHHPAFEIIFVYSQNDGTLDIYLTGDRRPVPALQEIFADTILKSDLGPDERDERVYDLNPVRTRQFQFVYGPESGIVNVAVKKLRLTVYGKKERILLEADPTSNKDAVYDLLDKVAKGIPLAQMAVTQVGIKVTFAHNPVSRKANTRSFDVAGRTHARSSTMGATASSAGCWPTPASNPKNQTIVLRHDCCRRRPAPIWRMRLLPTRW
jgi:hypothetical protein